MKRLTFKGFLYQYVRALSNFNTNDIKRLADEVPHNYRLAEPLVLYAMAINKRKYLTSVAKDDHLKKLILCFPEGMGWDDVVRKLESDDESVPFEFRKAYRSYVSVRDRGKAKANTKHMMLERSRKLQKAKRVSTYRIYTDLSLNHGNVNSYMKNGDVNKVSLEVAERVLDYLANV